MGKATITGGGTGGLYTIDYQYDTTAAEARKTVLTNQLATLNTSRLPQLETAKANAETTVNTASAALNAAIDLFKISSITKEQLQAYEDALLSASVDLARASSAVDYLKTDITSLTLQIAQLTAVGTASLPVSRSAWCADLSESLSGTVGTIEIDEQKTTVLIRPGATDSAVWNTTRDGIEAVPGSQTIATTFYNWAMRPGWEKWKPHYRVGVVNAKTDTGGGVFVLGVTLDAAYSEDTPTGAQLSINQSSTLSAVTIDYPPCQGNAFDIGDRVVVEFTGRDWNTPKVIGFESNPKTCGYFIKLLDHDGTTITPSSMLDLTGAGAGSRFIRFMFYPVGAGSIKKFTVTNGTLPTGVTFDSGTGYWRFVGVSTASNNNILVSATHCALIQYPAITTSALQYPTVAGVGYAAGSYTITMKRFAAAVTSSDLTSTTNRYRQTTVYATLPYIVKCAISTNRTWETSETLCAAPAYVADQLYVGDFCSGITDAWQYTNSPGSYNQAHPTGAHITPGPLNMDYTESAPNVAGVNHVARVVSTGGLFSTDNGPFRFLSPFTSATGHNLGTVGGTVGVLPTVQDFLYSTYTIVGDA